MWHVCVFDAAMSEFPISEFQNLASTLKAILNPTFPRNLLQVFLASVVALHAPRYHQSSLLLWDQTELVGHWSPEPGSELLEGRDRVSFIAAFSPAPCLSAGVVGFIGWKSSSSYPHSSVILPLMFLRMGPFPLASKLFLGRSWPFWRPREGYLWILSTKQGRKGRRPSLNPTCSFLPSVTGPLKLCV